MDGHSENDVLEEITRGGLPSNVRAELVAERDPVAEAAGLVHGAEAQPLAAIFDVGAQAPCPVFYSVADKIYPERCQLAAGHKPRTSTADHYHAAIGWWS